MHLVVKPRNPKGGIFGKEERENGLKAETDTVI
jgi:hypothetical protein